MLQIYVPDENDSLGTISLTGLEYFIRFTYNSTYDYWSMTLYSDKMEQITPMTKLLPNTDVFFYYSYDTNLPDGKFIVVTDLEKVGRQDFNDNKAYLLFYTNDELEEYARFKGLTKSTSQTTVARKSTLNQRPAVTGKTTTDSGTTTVINNNDALNIREITNEEVDAFAARYFSSKE